MKNQKAFWVYATFISATTGAETCIWGRLILDNCDVFGEGFKAKIVEEVEKCIEHAGQEILDNRLEIKSLSLIGETNATEDSN